MEWGDTTDARANGRTELPPDLQGVADAIASQRDEPSTHLLARVQRRVEIAAVAQADLAETAAQREPRTTTAPAAEAKRIIYVRRRSRLLFRPPVALGVMAAVALALVFGLRPALTTTSPIVGFSAASNTYCPNGTVVFQFHYDGNKNVAAPGFTGNSWSSVGQTDCNQGSMVSIGPATMEGNLNVTPGSSFTCDNVPTVQICTGYHLMIPSNKTPGTMVTVTNAQVVFQLTCGSSHTSIGMMTVRMPTQTYTFTGSEWEPSGAENSPSVYQSTGIGPPNGVVPPVCGAGQPVSFKLGGTFTATVNFSM